MKFDRLRGEGSLACDSYATIETEPSRVWQPWLRRGWIMGDECF